MANASGGDFPGWYGPPGGPDEDRGGGFTHGGWQAPLLGQESVTYPNGTLQLTYDTSGTPTYGTGAT